MTWERASAFICVGPDGFKGEFNGLDAEFCFWVQLVHEFSPAALKYSLVGVTACRQSTVHATLLIVESLKPVGHFSWFLEATSVINSQKSWMVSTQQPPKHIRLLIKCKLDINEPRWGLSGPFESFGFSQLRLLA